MRRLLLACALLLSGCTMLPPTAAPAPDPGAATLNLSSVEGKDYKIVRFGAGTEAAQGVTLTLSGINLAVNDPRCTARDAQLVCALGDLPAGRYSVLPARGVVVVEASYRRATGEGHTLAAD